MLFPGKNTSPKQSLKAFDVIIAKRTMRKTEKMNSFVNKFLFFFVKFDIILGMTRSPAVSSTHSCLSIVSEIPSMRKNDFILLKQHFLKNVQHKTVVPRC